MDQLGLDDEPTGDSDSEQSDLEEWRTSESSSALVDHKGSDSPGGDGLHKDLSKGSLNKNRRSVRWEGESEEKKE